MTTTIAGATRARATTRSAPRVASWPAVVAWGSGLVQLALGAGMLTSEGSDAAARAIGFALATLGAAGLLWGALTLSRGRIVAPRLGVAGALVGLTAGALALAVDPGRTSVVAVAAASALLVTAGVACAITLRRMPSAGRPGIVGLLIAAVVVAALVTPALAATEAGRLAPDHGGHELVRGEHQH